MSGRLTIIVIMKDRAKYEFKLDDPSISIEQVLRELNKNKFIRFGVMILNTQEIVSIEKVQS